MIRVSPPMVKQAPKRSTAPARRGITLLPAPGGPQIGRLRAVEQLK